VIEERERLAAELRTLGLAPLESHTNFLYVPVEDGLALNEALLRSGVVVRAYERAIRMSVRDREGDDVLVETLARILSSVT
jgi:histidinol-phosphate/aromatic aminotransferase/cobyric acid decarboxylase-like protein